MNSNLRIYHIQNGLTMTYPVKDPSHAKRLIEELAQSDLVNPVVEYNVFGLEEFNQETGDWEEWYDENGDDIDNTELYK